MTNAGTTTVVQATPNKNTYTAVVKAAGGATGTPTGEVIFYDEACLPDRRHVSGWGERAFRCFEGFPLR